MRSSRPDNIQVAASSFLAVFTMASSRSMRNSPRTASPNNVQTTITSTLGSDSFAQKDRLAIVGGWTEPPLRAPAPSFEDHKGLERQGVLEHMAPLGSLPTQKVKLRIKQYEPGRRPKQSKLGEGATILKESAEEPPAARRRSDTRMTEDHSSKAVAPHERDEDEDYNPKAAATTTKTVQTRSTPARPLLPEAPPAHYLSHEKLKQVVDSAVDRSRQLGNELLGFAIKRVFEESLNNDGLADLLDAVLSQRPTPRQAADFQAYIKVARKQIKAETSSSRRSSNAVASSITSKSASKSPCKPIQFTGANPSDTSHDTPSATRMTQASHPQPTSRSNKGPNGTAGSDREHPAKRLKRTKSMSSTSSLSSLDSNDPSMELDEANTTGAQAHLNCDSSVKNGAPLGPKLHTFFTVKYGNAASTRRPAQAGGIVTDESAAETVAKRKFQQHFDDYSVQDSNIRPSPSPRHLNGIPLPIMTGSPSLSSSKAQSRLRSGESWASPMDEHESLRSPGSSTHGDFLVPPPTAALRSSRATTPNQVGRPVKPVRRAARIKIS